MAILAKQRILTLDYWKFAHDLKVGDYVFDRNGQPQRVKVVQEYRSEECYMISFNDHLTVSGDQHMGLQVEDKQHRDRQLQYKGKYKFKRPLKFKKVSELPSTNLKQNNGGHAFSIPTTHPLQLPHQTLPVPPFVFAIWFMNKGSRERISVPHIYGEHVREKFKEAGYEVIERTAQDDGGRTITPVPKIERHLGYDLPRLIPYNYLLADKEQRLELLKGIIHSRRRLYSPTKNLFRFQTTNRALAMQFQCLVESLGFKTTLEENPYRDLVIIIFKSKIPLVANQKPYEKQVVFRDRRYIKVITKLPAQLCVHIETEGADNSYLVGEGFIAVC